MVTSASTPEKAPPPPADPPDRLRVAVVGTGSIGERHLRCFQATGRAEVIACEPNPDLGHAVVERYACPWFTTLEEAVAAQPEEKPIDAAILCTPAHLHIPLARQYVEAGLHLLIEKPLAVSEEGIPLLQQAARERERVVRVAYTLRSHPVYQRLKQRLGEIGEPRQWVSTHGQHFPTFRPAYRDIYYARHASGGGAIQDALTHNLHAAEWLLGPFASIMADADHLVLEGVEVEDCVHLSGRMAGGVLASFALNQFQAPNETYVTIHGTTGSLRADLGRLRVGLFRHGDDDWCWEALPAIERDEIFIRQAHSFLDALHGLPDTLATLEEGHQTLKVNLAALEAVRTRREVTLS
ncbi:MAG TPA: Gfo/Idh/MocA family oxidoreductase [Chthoniobacteraceae bacterium]|nr:Gfo/Idh/MocA family oxidoreductase [Chthoniobacteraceae bacterium]